LKKGFTLIELLIVVAIIAILAAIAVPNFLEAQVRAKIARVMSDQRSLATALETYYVDQNIYPAQARDGGTYGTSGVKENYNYYIPNVTATLQKTDSFAVNPIASTANNFGLMTLTTPVSYMSTYPSDAFATTKGATFFYYTQGSNWILWSDGPDGDSNTYSALAGDASGTPVEKNIVTNGVSLPSPTLLSGKSTVTGSTAFTYDATNGTGSGGDVWKVKG